MCIGSTSKVSNLGHREEDEGDRRSTSMCIGSTSKLCQFFADSFNPCRPTGKEEEFKTPDVNHGKIAGKRRGQAEVRCDRSKRNAQGGSLK